MKGGRKGGREGCTDGRMDVFALGGRHVNWKYIFANGYELIKYALQCRMILPPYCWLNSKD